MRGPNFLRGVEDCIFLKDHFEVKKVEKFREVRAQTFNFLIFTKITISQLFVDIFEKFKNIK